MDSKRIKVLYIDDEMPNLIGFKASFRDLFDIYLANSSHEAMELLEKIPDFHIVLSDQRMPDTTGVELLQTIRKLYPLPIRILITAYTDVESVIDAINKGNIFRYIKKPWVENDIITAIEEAHRYYVATSMLSIKNEELNIAYKELDKFAYSVTHDLKGPVTSIAGAIELIQHEEDLPTIRNILQMIRNSVVRLNEFIGSIHDYYTVNRGELHITVIDFKSIIEELKNIYEVAQTVGNIRFETRIDQSFEFRSDAMSIRLILNNLLSNAFKYQRKNNPDKLVELVITVDKQEAKIMVRDNGIGIAPEYLEHIFTMFYRATTEETGSGFGLYNVKDVLKKINGQIDVQSTSDEGCIFTVIIPQKK